MCTQCMCLYILECDLVSRNKQLLALFIIITVWWGTDNLGPTEYYPEMIPLICYMKIITNSLVRIKSGYGMAGFYV